jgi:hypothetical protein
MKSYSILKSRSLFLASVFMLGTTIGVAQANGVAQDKQCDMPDEIAAGDSAAVRADCPDQDKMKNKPRKYRANPDNSRYSTDGTERFDDGGNKGQEYSGTGPKREGRY